MRDVKRAQGTLELTAWIGVMVTGTRPKEAQRVGIDHLWQTMTLDGFAEMLEVIPGGITFDKPARHIEAGTIIDSEKQGLFARSWPPLVDRTVMLPKFSNMSAAKTPISPFLGKRRWNQVGKVSFDVGFDGSSGTLEVAEPF